MLDDLLWFGAFVALALVAYHPRTWSPAVLFGAPTLWAWVVWLAERGPQSPSFGVKLIPAAWVALWLVGGAVWGAPATRDPAPRRLALFVVTSGVLLGAAFRTAGFEEVSAIWLVSALASARALVWGRALGERHQLALSLAGLLTAAFVVDAAFETPGRWPVAVALAIHVGAAAWGRAKADPALGVAGAVFAVLLSWAHASHQSAPLAAELAARWDGTWDDLPVAHGRRAVVVDASEVARVPADRPVPAGVSRLLVRLDEAWPPSSRVGVVSLHPTDQPVNLRVIGGGWVERPDGTRVAVAALPEGEQRVVDPTRTTAADLVALCGDGQCGVPLTGAEPRWERRRAGEFVTLLVGFAGAIALGIAFLRDPRRSWAAGGVVVASTGLLLGWTSVPAGIAGTGATLAVWFGVRRDGWRERLGAIGVLAVVPVLSELVLPAPFGWLGWPFAMFGLPVAALAGTRATPVRAALAVAYLAWVGQLLLTSSGLGGMVLVQAVAAAVVVGPVLRPLMRLGWYRSSDVVAAALLVVWTGCAWRLRPEAAQVRMARFDAARAVPVIDHPMPLRADRSWCAVVDGRTQDLQTGLGCDAPEIAVLAADAPATDALALPASVSWFAVTTPSRLPRDRYALARWPAFDPAYPLPTCPLEGRTLQQAFDACPIGEWSRGPVGVAGAPVDR